MKPAREFAALMMGNYRNPEEAWKALDKSGDGTVSCNEFTAWAKALNYKGNSNEVFRLLDPENKGYITKAQYSRLQKLHDMESKAREDIAAAERKQDLAALAKAVQNGALRGVDDESLLRSQEAYQALMRKNMEAALTDGNNEEIARLLQIG